MTTSVTKFLRSAIPAAAFKPSGVAAPPAPMKLAAKFVEICVKVSAFSPGNSRFINGSNNFCNFSVTPDFSKIPMIGSQNAYDENNVKDSLSAFIAPSVNAGKVADGFRNNSSIIDAAESAEKTKFI